MLMVILGLVAGALTLFFVVMLGGLSVMANQEEKQRQEAKRVEDGRKAAEAVRRGSAVDRWLAS